MCAARCAAQLGGMRGFARLNDHKIVVTRSLAIDIAVEAHYHADRWRLRFGTDWCCVEQVQCAHRAFSWFVSTWPRAISQSAAAASRSLVKRPTECWSRSNDS